MILQSLARYYDRLLADGEVAAPGFQHKAIPWVLEISHNGTPIGLQNTERTFTVPAEIKRASSIAANLLWDNAEYVLGLARAGLTVKQAVKVPLRHAAFVERIKSLPSDAQSDPGVSAVIAFLTSTDRAALERLEGWDALVSENRNVTFRLAGDQILVCERPAVVRAVAGAEGESPEVRCLVTGQRAPLSEIHPSIKGVRGAQTSGASLVSFNLEAFTSHGWKQGRNAPVSVAAASAYTSALNSLLSRDHPDRHLVEGDTTFVFWAAEPSRMEAFVGGCFSGFEIAAEVEEKKVARTLGSVRTGLRSMEADKTTFHVLALAPNAARLAVRFWFEGTVADLARALDRHFADLEIAGLAAGDDAPLPSLWRILGAAAPGYEPKNLQDNLRGSLATEIVKAALDGQAYPSSLLTRTIDRCRAERDVRPVRAGVIKAVLNRHPVRRGHSEKEITVALDIGNTNAGYLLGRLFAVLEAIQRSANPGVNTTIRDRYFSAAGSAPRSAFNELMRLKESHLGKLRRTKGGLAVHFERQVDEIVASLDPASGFPATLPVDDQGRFIIGYHHQRSHRGDVRDHTDDTPDTHNQEEI